MNPPTSIAADTNRRTHIVVFSLIACAVLLRLIVVSVSPASELISPITDDAYYYFKVAQNIVRGDGVSFDGINRTNGFHPLWMSLLLPLFFISQTDGEVSLRLASGLQAVLAGGSLLCCWAYVTRRASANVGFLALLALLHPVLLNGMINGLETGLLIFMLFFTLWCTDRYSLLHRAAGHRKQLAVGVLLAMIFLSRLDTAFIMLALAILAVFFHADAPLSCRAIPQLLRRHGSTLLAFCVVIAPYFAWNLISFGHWMPISGSLKTSFPQARLRPDELFGFQWAPYTAFVLVATTWVVISLILPSGLLRSVQLPRWRRDREAPLLAALWLGSVLHFLYAALYLQWAAYWWHFASHVPLIAVLPMLGFERFIRNTNRRRARTIVAAVLILCGNVVSTIIERLERGTHHQPWLDAALWVRDYTPKSTVYAMTDCGLFGYFCERTTVNLDGVINGYDFQAALADAWLPKYLEDCGVTAIADYEVPDTGADKHIILLPARLHRKAGYQIALSPATASYRSGPYQQRTLSGRRKPPIRFIIWPIASASVEPR